MLFAAKRERAKAKADRRRPSWTYGSPSTFDGIVDRQHEQQGSLIKEGDMLTTLSDNRIMWVYFNVPENNTSNTWPA